MVSIEQIDGHLFQQMIVQAARHLNKNKEKINKLNVFPVPDGDTGTNMSASINSGVTEMQKETNMHVSELANAFAKGVLMGARGNSGVILSQLFQGFKEAIDKKETINTKQFAHALEAGVKTAYKAVNDPVEGTILTVAKDVANRAVKNSQNEKNLQRFMEMIVKEGQDSLNRTPHLLPILQEVGVVDSGGKGLLSVYEGFLAAITGKGIEDKAENMKQLIEKVDEQTIQSYIDKQSIKYSYCTEFIIEFEDAKKTKYDEQIFRKKLSEYGDSLLIATNESYVKVHLHTELPGEVMTLSQNFGRLINIDIENMKHQYETIIKEENKQKSDEKLAHAMITIASGSGLVKLFKSLGVSKVIAGGQTMNPSTEDILNTINKVNADHIYLLPNNKNIILAAEQAAKNTKQNVTVIPTVSIQQGLMALFEFDATLSHDDNYKKMTEGITSIKEGAVTYATRDTTIDGQAIKQNEFIGMMDKQIKVTHEDKLIATKQLLAMIVDESKDEIITVIVGDDVTGEEKKSLENFILNTYGSLDIEVHQGDQPIYSFLLMVE